MLFVNNKAVVFFVFFKIWLELTLKRKKLAFKIFARQGYKKIEV